jgi:Mn2+/Fe2+ NRAMP family transporter
VIRGVLSITGAIILVVLLFRVIQGDMSLMDVAVRGLVIVLCISVVDKVLAPTIGAALRGMKVDDDPAEAGEPSPTAG